MFLLTGAACSSGEAPALRTASSIAERAATSDPRGVEVMAKWGAETSEGLSFLKVLLAFEQKTGIKVNYVGVGDQLPIVLSTRVAAGVPPDIAILPQPGLLEDLAAIGALVPISDAVGDIMDANFAPLWTELGSANGVLYGVFFKGSNKSTVWYDVEVFNANGIVPPPTWDDWIAAAGTLVDAGITPISVAGADGWILSDWFENVYLRTAGPEKYDQLANHEIPWTDQSVKDALAVMGQLLGVDDFLAGGARGALQTGFVASVRQVFSDVPQAAAVYGGDFVAGVILGETTAIAGIDFAFFDFPSIDGSPPAMVGGGDVAVVLKQSEEALALIEYLARPEAGAIWAGFGGFSSPNKNVDLSVYPDDVTRAAAESLANADVFRFDLSDLVQSCFGGTAGSGIWGGLQDWLAAPADIDRVTKQLETDASC